MRVYDAIFYPQRREKVLENLKNELERIKDRKIIFDTQSLVNYLLLVENRPFAPLLDVFYEVKNENFGYFRRFFEKFKDFQKAYLEIIKHLCSKDNVFIPEEIMDEIRNLKNKRNRKIRNRLSSLDRFLLNDYGKKFPKRGDELNKKIKDLFCNMIIINDRHILSDLEKIFDKKNIIKQNKLNKDTFIILKEISKNYPPYNIPSYVDMVLATYLFDGYDVFSKDKHILRLAVDGYPKIKTESKTFLWHINCNLELICSNINENLLRKFY